MKGGLKKCSSLDCWNAFERDCSGCGLSYCDSHLQACEGDNCGKSFCLSCRGVLISCDGCSSVFCVDCLDVHEGNCSGEKKSFDVSVSWQSNEEGSGGSGGTEDNNKVNAPAITSDSSVSVQGSGGWLAGVLLVLFFSVGALFVFGGGKMSLAGWSFGLLVVLLFFLVFLFFKSLLIIRPTQRAVIERLGKYNRFATPGLNILLPFLEVARVVNVTEKMVDAMPQEIITLDKLNATVDAQVYFKVKADEENVKASQYNVYDFESQIVSLARTTLRNIIGNMSLNDANSKRNVINDQLMVILTKETNNWGIEVVRTELKEINPPALVQETMNSVVMAENKKVAARDLAEATETEADGRRRAAIKIAEGEGQGTRIKAQAEADAIKLVNEAANKYFVGNAQKLRSMEMVEKSLAENAKVIITEKGISPTIVLGDSSVFPIKKK